jgi:hypothetical protein
LNNAVIRFVWFQKSWYLVMIGRFSLIGLDNDDRFFISRSSNSAFLCAFLSQGSSSGFIKKMLERFGLWIIVSVSASLVLNNIRYPQPPNGISRTDTG